jgi:uncharacterized protein YbjT (DUF2867 family)
MNIVVTGSLGNISKPLSQQLISEGHRVTVISSNTNKQTDIEAIGAKAAIGNIEDVTFLASVLTNADATYLMFPPINYFNMEVDLKAHISNQAKIYKMAIELSGVKNVVILSSAGAHTDIGTGILSFYYHAERILETLQDDVNILFIRPVGFYQNLFGQVYAIKTYGIIQANYGGDTKRPWVSPLDIASVIGSEIIKPLIRRRVRYVVSDEVSCNEIAHLIGAAIGKPNLQWKVVSDKETLNGLIAAGMNVKIAEGIVEMNAKNHSGTLYTHYEQNKPKLGTVKAKDFIKVFATIYNEM